MELVTLGLVVAKFGIDQVVGALLGEATVDLGRELTGIMTSVERAEQRLSVIESKLDLLIDQRFTVAMGTGFRQLDQALLAERDPVRRRADLDHAQHSLIQATQAATTKLQQARAERLLVFTQIAAGDPLAAAASWTRLDASIGDACADAFSELEHSRDAARLAVRNEHSGWRSAAMTHGRRHDLMREHRLRTEVRIGDLYGELRDLLQDSIQLGRLLGQADVVIGKKRTVRTDYEYTSDGRSEGGGSLLVEVPWGQPVNIAGAAIRMQGPDDRKPEFEYSSGFRTAKKLPGSVPYKIVEYHATVRLSPERTRGGVVGIQDSVFGSLARQFPSHQIAADGKKAHLSYGRGLDEPPPTVLAVVATGIVILTHPATSTRRT